MFDTTHIHPMLVHFPIALALLGFLFEATNQLFLQKKGKSIVCGEYILYFATLAAIVTVLSGYLFTGTFAGRTLEVRDDHAMYAVTASILLIATTLCYLLAYKYKVHAKKLRGVGLFLYFLSAIAVGITGAIGGTLVYTYMIGL